MLTLYHNPRCSKSRQTLDLLKSKGLTPTIIDYLKNPPTAQELDEILKKLKMEPQEIVRTKEEVYEELGLKNKSLTRSEMIDVLIQNPVLIERPIVVKDNKAALGRPPERVLGFLEILYFLIFCDCIRYRYIFEWIPTKK